MVRTLLKLVVAALILHAGYRAAVAYYHWFTFKDDVDQIALAAERLREDDVLERVVAAAAARQVPIGREAVKVRKTRDHTYIDIEYVEQVLLAPSYTYPWTFTVRADGWHVKPATASDVLGQPPR